TVTDKDADTWKASLYFEGAQPGSNTYGTFLWGDNPFTTIINKEAQTNRKIAIVKESYGNAIVPYIAYNYSEVYVVDFRYYSENLKTLCEQNNINEVLFINGIMSANTASQIDNMNNLFI
ncbi:MAG: DHHW family protein, partial [Oscillospiraceae bacterium]